MFIRTGALSPDIALSDVEDAFMFNEGIQLTARDAVSILWAQLTMQNVLAKHVSL